MRRKTFRYRASSASALSIDVIVMLLYSVSLLSKSSIRLFVLLCYNPLLSSVLDVRRLPLLRLALVDAWMLPPPLSSSVTIAIRRRTHRRKGAIEGDNGRLSGTELSDAYEDQYTAYLRSMQQQEQTNSQSQQQQPPIPAPIDPLFKNDMHQNYQQQQEADMSQQYDEFEGFVNNFSSWSSSSSGPTLGSPVEPLGPEPAYSSSVYAGSYLDTLSGSSSSSVDDSYNNIINNKNEADVYTTQPPSSFSSSSTWQQPQEPVAATTASYSSTSGNDGGKDVHNSSKAYQDLSTSLSFADLAEPGRTPVPATSFSFMGSSAGSTGSNIYDIDNTSNNDDYNDDDDDDDESLAELLSVTQSKLDKIDEEITSINVLESRDTGGDTNNSLGGHMSTVPFGKVATPSQERRQQVQSWQSSIDKKMGFTYSDGISKISTDESKIPSPKKTRDRSFGTLTTPVTVQVEHVFPRGTDIVKLKDAWLDFVWTNGGGIMIPNKLSSRASPSGCNDNIREFFVPFGLKQELISAVDGNDQVSISYRTIRRGPFFQDIVLGSHIGTVVFDKKTEGLIAGPKMTWTIEFDVNEIPPVTDWDQVVENINNKLETTMNDYLIMASRVISTTTTKLTTRASLWESWTAWQIASATENFVAYVEDGEDNVIQITVEELMPVGITLVDVMDAWYKHCWKFGGGISLGNFCTLDTSDGGKDFNKISTVVPGTIIPPIVFEKTGKKRRWIIPSLLEEEITSDGFSLKSKEGQIMYKVTNPNLFTYPVHFHRGQVDFKPVSNIMGSSFEGYATEERTRVVWTVTFRPYRKFLGRGVRFWTEANMSWSLRNLKLLLEDQAAQGKSTSGREWDRAESSGQSGGGGYVDEQNEQGMGRNFPKIMKFDRSTSMDASATRPTFNIPNPGVSDEFDGTAQQSQR